MERPAPAAQLPGVVVMSRRQAAAALLSQSQCASFACLVSIGDPGQATPEGFTNLEHRLRLEFHDAVAEEQDLTLPSPADVRRLVEFARRHAGSAKPVLVHCEAGISRSTAAAVILHAVWLGAGAETDAARKVLEAAPEARPNARMLAQADVILDRGGAILAAVQQVILRNLVD